jgi:CHAT domain-containing protein
LRRTTVSLTNIDGYITIAQNSLSLLPRSDQTYIEWVHGLAKARFVRYNMSQQKEDLDKSIAYGTEAIFLQVPPISQDGVSFNIVQLLFHLARALLERSKKFKRPEDVKYSIEYLRYLRELPLESSKVHRYDVTASLIGALSTQVKLDAGDGIRDITEMVALCRELLTSNILTDFPVGAFRSLNQSVDFEIVRGRPVHFLDGVIDCLRDAVKVCPSDSYYVFFALAQQLCNRFLRNHSNHDYEEAAALLERILGPNQPEKCPDSMRVLASPLATLLVHARSAIFPNPEHFEVAISHLRTELSSSAGDEGLRLHLTEGLALQTRLRFRQYGLAESLDEANSFTSQLVDISSSENPEKYAELFRESDAVRESYSMTRMVEKIQELEELLSVTPPGTQRHSGYLCRLANWYEAKFSSTNDISDIEESIKYSRLLLNVTRSSGDWERIMALNPFHNILRHAFEKTGKISYLEESISIGYDILQLKTAQPLYFFVILKLVSALLTREKLLGGSEGRHEAIRLISKVVDNQYGQEPDRFRLSCEWAIVARNIDHPTTLTAYRCAMSLMQKSLSFAPTVSVQHVRLVAMGGNCQTVPLDYASYQIKLGQFEEAVETLEQGRALLWSEMRGLRTPIAHLIEEDSLLAKRFAEINQELEALTTSVTPSGRPEKEDGLAQGRGGMDQFGQLVVKQRRLLEERDALISQIQCRPGLESFLRAPPFTTLRSAASCGPVIIINHCEWRSDILILFQNHLPCSLPTADDFYRRANKLLDEQVEARKHGLDSREYQDALCSVLKGLYALVGEPVIKRLRLLGVPEQSRVWWCPTSVFCSLPLHAMGPIPSSDTCGQYFSDLYIPSYTPSLSALIESRRASPQTLEMPSLLLVAQPDDSLPGVNGEVKVIERALKAQVTVASLVSSEATPSSVLEGLRGSRFAHFACHGVLETGKPFEASFNLHRGSRLTLLDIIRSRLPNAEFAFLSCCHAAEVTEESIADEALHLTAAMQYCGFRSVVGTMWEMADTDGRDLAKSFYKSLFSNEGTSVPYYKRSAGALRDATRKLREKRGITLERWVNFVHYGA